MAPRMDQYSPVDDSGRIGCASSYAGRRKRFKLGKSLTSWGMPYRPTDHSRIDFGASTVQPAASLCNIRLVAQAKDTGLEVTDDIAQHGPLPVHLIDMVDKRGARALGHL